MVNTGSDRPEDEPPERFHITLKVIAKRREGGVSGRICGN